VKGSGELEIMFWKWNVRILTFKYLVEIVIVCGLVERNEMQQEPRRALHSD
jgi:hypothetical protein